MKDGVRVSGVLRGAGLSFSSLISLFQIGTVSACGRCLSVPFSILGFRGLGHRTGVFELAVTDLYDLYVIRYPRMEMIMALTSCSKEHIHIIDASFCDVDC